MSFKKVCNFEIPKDDRDEIRDILCQLVHASDESVYSSLKEDLFQIACEDFKKHFLKNWDSCQSMWVSFKRDTFSHYGNTTNNRLESSHSKLKHICHQSDKLSEMFQNLQLNITTCASEYSHAAFEEEFKLVSTADDEIPGVAVIKSVCTSFAAALVIGQLKLSAKIAYSVTVEDST